MTHCTLDNLNVYVDSTSGLLIPPNFEQSELEKKASNTNKSAGVGRGLASTVILAAVYSAAILGLTSCASSEQRLAKRLANEREYRKDHYVIARPGSIAGPTKSELMRKKNYYEVWDKHGLVYYVPKEGALDVYIFLGGCMDRLAEALPGGGGDPNYPIVIPEKDLIIFPDGFIMNKPNWKLDDD